MKILTAVMALSMRGFLLLGGSFLMLGVGGSSSLERVRAQRPDPVPLVAVVEEAAPTVSFPLERGVFAPVDFVTQINGMEQAVFMEKMRGQLPRLLHRGFERYAPKALEAAQKYAVDPFWVIAVMWVESHFNNSAVSPVGARGLMQVMPLTGRYLTKKLRAVHYGPHERRAFAQYTHPHINIEMGVYYLSYLSQKFSSRRHPYDLATIAYNMGPGRLRTLLRRRFPIRKRSSYLKKVRQAYLSLLKPFKGSYGKTASTTPDRQSTHPPTVL